MKTNENLLNNYHNIPIDTVTIPQTDLNIAVKTRTNLFSWNGQFSPQFVESEISYYARKGFSVLDPFAGSGTTLCECARKGLRAYGIELNPSAYYMAKTYELVTTNIEMREKIICAVDRIIEKSIEGKDILKYLLFQREASLGKAESEIISTLVILLDIFKNEITTELIRQKWLKLKNTIISLPYSSEMVIAENKDARRTGLSSKSVDLLLTSPPYINVFNYHQNYRKSVEALGFNVLNIAKSEFGSNRKNRGNRFLTVIQYCIDMALAINEANRVCKDGARMIYVVGRESTVLGYSFCNSELIYSIATEIFNLPFDIKQERVFKNRYGQMIYEDILHLINCSSQTLKCEDIIEKARKIAVRMLKERLEEDNENKNAEVLKEAIDKANLVKESEIFV